MNINGRNIAIDKEGFICDLADWTEEVAEALAKNEEIQLTEEHWQILRHIRLFYERYQLSPAMRPFVKFIRQELGDNKGKSIYLMKLFPGSPAKLASKIAGLPKPDNCL